MPDRYIVFEIIVGSFYVTCLYVYITYESAGVNGRTKIPLFFSKTTEFSKKNLPFSTFSQKAGKKLFSRKMEFLKRSTVHICTIGIIHVRLSLEMNVIFEYCFDNETLLLWCSMSYDIHVNYKLDTAPFLFLY